MSGPFRRLVLIASLLTSVLILGTAGYRLIEGRSLFDSFYMALIAPFRRFLVYPAILRHLHRSWLARFGVVSDGQR